MDWLFIDDSKEDRESFAQALSNGGSISVRAIAASGARELLANGTMNAAGILMDIDLSNESVSKESGLGLTADIRAAQHRGAIPPFPIVRFSYRDKVAQNIGRDSSSDQYFDLKVDKDGLSDQGIIATVQGMLAEVAEVYVSLDPKLSSAASFAVDDKGWNLLGSDAFEKQFKVADRHHVRARLIVEALVHPGILISEDYLAVRLGIDRTSDGWKNLLGAVAGWKYAGIAAHYFSRWWARGVETWWDELANDSPLAATSTADRHRVLSATFPGLAPLAARPESPGDRPWRACALTMEETGTFLPRDPTRAVRFAINASTPEWLDPTYAALGPAVKHAEDPRLDQSDLTRLKALARNA